eukprot:2636676-Prymnesium_polylepis.1
MGRKTHSTDTMECSDPSWDTTPLMMRVARCVRGSMLFQNISKRSTPIMCRGGPKGTPWTATMA